MALFFFLLICIRIKNSFRHNLRYTYVSIHLMNWNYQWIPKTHCISGWLVKYIWKKSASWVLNWYIVYADQTGNGREKRCFRMQNFPQTLRQQKTPCNEGMLMCLVVSCLKLTPVVLLLHGINGNTLYCHLLMIRRAVYTVLHSVSVFQCRICNTLTCLSYLPSGPLYCCLLHRPFSVQVL